MALKTKTVSGTPTTNDFTLKLELTENSTNTDANTSSVSWELQLHSGGWNFSKYSIGWSVSLAGEVVSSKARADAPQRTLGKNSYIVIASGTNNVSHGDDGALDMSVSASIAMEKVSYTPGDLSLSGSMALTPIALASAITSAGTITLGNAVSIKWTPADKSYKFRVYFTFGTDSKNYKYNSGWKPGSDVYIEPNSTAEQTYTDFTIPLTVAEYITSATYGTMTAHLSTHKADGTQIGSTQIKDFRVDIPASVKPSVSSVALSDEKGYLPTYGAYVQGFSRLKLKATASQAYGSAIKSYSFTVDGNKTTLASDEATVDLPNAGTIPVVVRVTDARGRVSDDYSTTIYVYPYEAPKITSVSAFRCAADGTPDAAGTFVGFTFSGYVSPLGGNNTSTWKIQRRAENEESWTNRTLTGLANHYTAGGDWWTFRDIAADSSYIFRVSVTDALTGEVTSVEALIPVGYAFFRTNAEMDGFTFGRETVKHNMFGCAWDAEFDGAVAVAGDLTLGGHESKVGSVLQEQTDGTVSAASSSNTKVAEITLPAGAWVLTGTVYFPTADTGYRLINLSPTSADSSFDSPSATVQRNTGTAATVQVTGIVSNDEQTTVYLNCRQTSGSAQSVHGYIKAVRIA